MEEPAGYPHQDVKNVAQAPKMWATPDRVHEPLYAIVPLTNFWRIKNRWKHFLRAIEHFKNSGATVYVIEVALHERDHAVDDFAPNRVLTDAPAILSELAPNCRHDSPYRAQHRYIRVRKEEDDGLWMKENLINVAARYLPSDWKYVCWLDGDIAFARPNWVGETIQLLQEFKFLQMMTQAQDLDADYTAIGMRDSFIWAYIKNGKKIPRKGANGYYYGGAAQIGFGWSGLAWATRREVFDAIGGIPDFGIHGGMDWHMAFALVGQVEQSVRKDLHPNYLRRLLQWQKLTEKYVRRNVGCMTGTILHQWHGNKKHRQYSERHKLLADARFDPDKDLLYDSQGLLRLIDDETDHFLMLRDGLRKYAVSRKEDLND